MLLPPELAGAIDDLMKADLQLWRDRCFFWLLFSTAIVIIGVVLEGPELVYETASIARRKRGKVDSEEQHRIPDWVALLGLLGWLLVVSGVAGEYIAEAMVSNADGNLQTFNDIMLTGARRETALAFERAADAERNAGEANSRASANEKEAAQLRKEAEGERLARVRLQEDIAPRRLVSADREKLAAKLTGSNKVFADIEYGAGDTEAYAFGVDLGKALQLVHWRSSEPHNYIEFTRAQLAFGGWPPLTTGVVIETCPNDTSRKAGSELHDGLAALGFDSIAKPECGWGKSIFPPLQNPEGVRIDIRPRPEGPQGAAKLRHEKLKRMQAK
jgi:hypothetical protein